MSRPPLQARRRRRARATLLALLLPGVPVLSMSSRPALAQPAAAPASAASAAPAPGAAAIALSAFDQTLEPWREVRLNPKLRPNRVERVDWDGVAALRVLSDASMSLMARPVTLDLQRTPVLCWRWRVDAPLKAADITRRSGDDTAARLYVSLRIPPQDQGFALRAQLGLARAIYGPQLPDAALNYVWDNRQAVGSEQANAYTDRAWMIVLRSGAADAGRWVTERRDIAADAARLFGPSAVPVQLAVAADTDDTGESARAGFADLHAVPRELPCRF